MVYVMLIDLLHIQSSDFCYWIRQWFFWYVNVLIFLVVFNLFLFFLFRYKNQNVAVKIVHKGETPEEIARREARFAREVAMLSKVQHKNLVKVSFQTLCVSFICIYLVVICGVDIYFSKKIFTSWFHYKWDMCNI